MRVLVSRSEMISRIQSRSYRLRFLAALLVGHIYGTFGWGVGVALAILASSMWSPISGARVDLGIDLHGVAIFQVIGNLIIIPFATLFLGLAALPATMIFATMTLLPAAVFMPSNYYLVIISGAVVGMIYWLLFGYMMSTGNGSPLMLVPAACMGCGYALALWQICLASGPGIPKG